MSRNYDTDMKYSSNQLCKNNDNYVKTKTKSASFQTEAITELKDTITLNYTKINQK